MSQSIPRPPMGKKADIVFMVDTGYYFSGSKDNIKANLNEFVDELERNNIDAQFSLVLFTNFSYSDDKITTVYNWITADECKNEIDNLSGYGVSLDDRPSLYNAIEDINNMNFREDASKYIIMIEDYVAPILSGNRITLFDGQDNVNMEPQEMEDSVISSQEDISNLIQDGVCFSSISYFDGYTPYESLVYNTNGVTGNVYSNFSEDLKTLLKGMETEIDPGCIIKLSNGFAVKLDKDPSLGDDSIDTDEDGIPDLAELGEHKTFTKHIPFTDIKTDYDYWTFSSNPASNDTDGDGILDDIDLKPSIFDTRITEETDKVIKFNTGRTWNNITCNSFDYMANYYNVDGKVNNPIPADEFHIIIDNVSKNEKQKFNIDELTVIGLLNNEGSKLYMTKRSGNFREALFRRLANRASKFYGHSGALWWSDWKEVPRGSEGGFFKGVVFSEADLNFSTKLYFAFDVYMVLDTLARTGAIIIAVIVAVEATPVVLANLQGIIFYCKEFGIVEGLKIYMYNGISTLPNSVITWVQWDIADGDSSIDDVVPGTGTVWDNINPTQSNIDGTEIPKSFVITSNGKKFWVHPNGTKHMAEYITRNGMSHGMPMNSQTILTSFQNSLNIAITQGINYEQIMKIGNWELIFSQARGEELLTVIKHAVYIP